VYGGYETFVKELGERLVKMDYEIVVYCHRSLFTDRPKKVNGIELVYVPCFETKIFSQFSHSFLSMFHICFTRNADLILTVNSANGPFGLLAKIFRIPAAINVDGLEWLRPKWAGLGAKYFRFASWLSTKLYDRVITDADAMRDVYLREFNKDSTVIAYGANPVSKTENTKNLTELRIEPKKYLLVVGRLIPDNNVEMVVHAFEKTQTDFKLVIVGDVPYKDAYAEKVRSTKDQRVIFPGYVKDQNLLMQLYEHCYIYIHGHEFGGTNPALLKALTAGCCILAVDTVFSREVLAEGKFGILFKKNAEDLSRQILKSLSQPELCDTLRRQAPDRIREKYTWEHVVSQYTDLFKEMSADKQ
jgi:glycosyltransferase involved in cell wall biosynthesis